MSQRGMKNLTIYMNKTKRGLMLAAIVCLILLTSCAAREKDTDEARERWNARVEYAYPFGWEARINAMTLEGNTLLVTANGQRGPEAALLTLDRDGEGHPVSSVTSLDLDGQADEDRYVYASAMSGGTAWLLLGRSVPEDTAADYSGEYTLMSFDAHGTAMMSCAISFGSVRMPYGLFAVDGGLYIWSLGGIYAVPADGGPVSAVFESAEDIWPVSTAGGDVYAQINTSGAGCYTLKFDFSGGRCSYERAEELNGISSFARTQTDAGLLINDGQFLSVYAPGEDGGRIDLYEALGSYSEKYKRICRIDDGSFVFSRSGSGELMFVDFEYGVDGREPLNIARLTGEELWRSNACEKIRLFNLSQDEYRVVLSEIPADEANTNRLLIECASKDAPDLVLCDGQLHSDKAFADLTPYIEDGRLYTAEDYPDGLFPSNSRNGKTYEVWGGYGILTLTAFSDTLIDGDTLRLGMCREAFETEGRWENMFTQIGSDVMTDEEAFFSFFAEHLFDPKSGEIDRELLDAVLELLPEAAKEPVSGTMLQFEVIGSMDRINGLSTAYNGRYRFFDGTNGGDNFTELFCAPGECMMVPAAGGNREGACSFIRFCLASENQLKFASSFNTMLCASPAARDIYYSRSVSAADREKLETLIRGAAVNTREFQEMSRIVFDRLRPCLDGGQETDVCIQNAERALEIYISEHE